MELPDPDDRSPDPPPPGASSPPVLRSQSSSVSVLPASSPPPLSHRSPNHLSNTSLSSAIRSPADHILPQQKYLTSQQAIVVDRNRQPMVSGSILGLPKSTSQGVPLRTSNSGQGNSKAPTKTWSAVASGRREQCISIKAPCTCCKRSSEGGSSA